MIIQYLKKAFPFFLLLLVHVQTVLAQKITDAQLKVLNNSVKAGKDPYFIESLDTFSRQGPDCITRDLIQDQKGNIWLATWKGIIQYDGTIFTNYTLKEGLIHFHVVSCYEDKKGNLWFGTARGGCYRYDGKSFKHFTMENGLSDNSISCFAEDREGNIWLATDKGASKYDGETFVNFTVKDGLPSNKVCSIIKDKSGKLWLGCAASTYSLNDGGLVSYDGKRFSNFSCKGKVSITTVSSLFEDKRGNIWIGSIDGLSLYDGTSVVELGKHLSYYIIDDKDGNVWLTVAEPPGDFHPNTPNQMLCRYDGKKRIVVLEKYKPGDCQIFGKMADNKGNIWLGTMKGVCRYDGKMFHYFTD